MTESKQLRDLRSVFSRIATDPNAWQLLRALPNPDPIIRKAGKRAEVFAEISRDAHVIGELRSMRAGLLAYPTELVPGGTDAASMASYEVAKRLFSAEPGINSRWADIDWHLYSAILNGYACLHLGKFIQVEGFWVPSSIEAWENRRFAFDPDHRLLLKTKANLDGEPTDSRRFLCVRHMPAPDNAYGIALLSSCFWPWTFKHGGFQFFVQLCERFGIPFPIGKYPQGAEQKDINDLLDGLAKLVEDGIAAIPDDTSVEILERKGSGEPVQAQLIELCNREMSKALTSQTLASEQNGQGARAASETHAKRAGENQRADRALVSDARNQIIAIVHQVNFTSGRPPKFIFKDRRDINLETVNRVRETARLVPVTTSWAYAEMGVPEPKEGEALLEVKDSGQGIATPTKTDFSAPEFNEFDQVTAAEIGRLWQFAKNAESLEELRTHILQSMPGISANAMSDVLKQTLELEFLQGMSDANDGQELELELSARP